MKKSGLVYFLVVLVLSGAAMLVRSLELSTVLDAGGLAVFKPATAVVICLSLLTAVFCVFFVRRYIQARTGEVFTAEYASFGLFGVVLGAASLLVQLYGAWLLFRGWKSGGNALDLILAVLAGLAGAGWLSMRIEENKGKEGYGARFAAGSVVTLFYCFWLIVYYRDEAPEPSMVLTVYAFLTLCACAIAAYQIAGGSVGKLRPRLAAAFCGVAMYLSLVALVRAEPASYRLFWLAGAVQFALSGTMLLGPCEPFPAPEKEEETGSEPSEAPAGDAAPAVPAQETEEGEAASETGED